MSRARTMFCCRSCGAAAARWSGRCATCGEWNALEEKAPPPPGATAGLSAAPMSLADVDLTAAVPRRTGLDELDRVLGGGLVGGSVTLLGGEPGVGKSTLLLQVLRHWASPATPVLLVCAEESLQQVRLRAERLGPLPEHLMLLATTDVHSALRAAHDTGATLVVVDSIQTVRDDTTAGAAGSVAQVRACADLLVGMAKRTDVPVILVGHVTKDGALAGPRLLEHVVDTVLTVEGDRHHALRVVRAVKHRFGPTGELGLFQMGDGGLGEVADPHTALLGDRRPGQPGSVVLPAVEGQRALLVEVQALVAAPTSPGSPPRRQTQGLDAGRLTTLLAVLEARTDLALHGRDVFSSVVGGLRIGEPAADLAAALAVASAARRHPLPSDLVAFGEVGLGGEIRHVRGAERRLLEAARSGFRTALVPPDCPDVGGEVRLLRVDDLAKAVAMFDA